MKPVNSTDEILNFEESYISLENKETQTDATDSFLENYYLRIHRSQNTIASENSIKLLQYCQRKGEGGAVTIKDNTIIIKEPFGRNTQRILETISHSKGPSGPSSYCEEVLVPYLKTPPADCDLDEHLAIDFPEDIPDYQPSDIEENTKAMKDTKTNIGTKCDDQGPKTPCTKPETTELVDLGPGLKEATKKVISAVFSPICKDCAAMKADEKPSNKPQEPVSPCKKSSSTHLADVASGLKNCASKVLSAICPKRGSEQSDTEKSPPETESAIKSESTGHVQGAYTACKKKTICIAKGVKSSLSNLLCTPCPCPKPCDIPTPCSSANIAASSLGEEQSPCPPSEEKPSCPPEEEKPPCPPKEEIPPCPPKEEIPPCPPKEEIPPCPPKEEKPPCPPKEEEPPCPPKEEKPPCPSKKKKTCPPKANKCQSNKIDPKTIKDPVIAIKMPKCPGEKPKYYLTDRSKVCKTPSCESIQSVIESRSLKPNAFTLENKINMSNETISTSENETVTNINATGNATFRTETQDNHNKDSSLSLKRVNTTIINNEIKSNNTTTSDSKNERPPNIITTDKRGSISETQDISENKSSHSVKRVNAAILNNEIIPNSKITSDLKYETNNNETTENVLSGSEKLLNLDKESIHSSKLADILPINNTIKSNTNIAGQLENQNTIHAVSKDIQEMGLKGLLVKQVTMVKESMTYLVNAVQDKTNEPAILPSDESQVIKITETSSNATANNSASVVSSKVVPNNSENKELDEVRAIDQASSIMAPIVARLAGAVDSTMSSLRERLDLDRFSSTVKENVREITEPSSPYDRQSVNPIQPQELSHTVPPPEEPSSLTKSVFTTIKSKLFGMFSDRDKTDDTSNSAGPVLKRSSKLSVNSTHSDLGLD